MGRGWRHDWGVAPVWLGLFKEFVSAKSSARRTGAGGGEVSKYVSPRGGVGRFSLCQRGEALLVFVEVEGEMLEVKEPPVFQRALVSFLRGQGVPTEI